jgi:hypothetical protein
MDALKYDVLFDKTEEIFKARHQIILKLLNEEWDNCSQTEKLNRLMQWLSEGNFTDSYHQLKIMTALILGLLYYEEKI